MKTSRSVNDNYISKYTLCIYKAQRKDYVTFKEIMARFRAYTHGWFHIVDYGIHVGGRYNQLHLHAIVQGDGVFSKNINSQGWSYVLRHYTDKTYREGCPYWRYIHSEDWANPYKLEQLLASNKYYSSPWGGEPAFERSEICGDSW